jgi:hypothetical protein
MPPWDSNPRSQQASGRRPTPWTARPLRPAHSHHYFFFFFFFFFLLFFFFFFSFFFFFFSFFFFFFSFFFFFFSFFVFFFFFSFFVFFFFFFSFFVFFFLFFLRHYNFREILAFSTSFFHLVRFPMQSFQFVIFILVISLFTSSPHLFLGLPSDLVSAGDHTHTFFTMLLSGIRCTCPNQANLCALM